jgi:signal transduction histidine kinase
MRAWEWQGVFEAFADPLLVLGPEGVTWSLNDRLAEWLCRSDGGIGIYWTTLLAPKGSVPDCPISRSLEEKAPHAGEMEFGALPGVWQVTASPLRSSDRLAGGVVVAMKEITQDKRRQEMLLRASQLAEVGQLAGGIAHEINTPLASIALRAESLLRKAQDPALQAVPTFERFPKYLEAIDRETFRCKKIIAALLDFARSGQPQARSIDLNAVAEAAGELIAHELKQRSVTLVRNLDPSLPVIVADDVRLRQALLALLVNALEASSPGGVVEIATSQAGPAEVLFSVTDGGRGISPEDLPRVFDPFFTTKPMGSGIGLGLAMCRGIVLAHGGSVAVESEPGRGARFTVRLPVEGRS